METMLVFSKIGIDCFGPFSVVRSRTNVKRYGVIFTCLSSRAVHLEVLFSLDTDSFLSALSRFMLRRGPIKIIRSDNGTNFTSGNRELNTHLAAWNVQCESWLTRKGIEWKFQPPGASHFGGVWERLIRIVRNVLDAILSEQNIKLHDERLNTLMCEVENIINNRPITELSDDPNDLEHSTPNHLLLSGYTPGPFSENDLHSSRKWKQVQYLSNFFWNRWIREYLPLLQSRCKWKRDSNPLKIGDLVLLTDQLPPRNQWSTGRIVHIFSDRLGYVRSAIILVAKLKGFDKFKRNFECDRVVVERPIVKLVLLKSCEA